MPLVGKHNIAKMYSSTTGTGTLTLTTAVPLCNTFANAGVVNSERVTYVITDPASGREVGLGTYTSSGTTLSRDTVYSSTDGGAKINCSGRQTVAITLASEDITPFSFYFYGAGVNTIANGVNNSTLSIDTESSDDTGMSTLAANAVTLTKKGWYQVNLIVDYSSGATAMNGRTRIAFESINLQHGYTTAMGITSNQFHVSLLINAASDGEVLGPVTFSNNSGTSIDAYVFELTVTKIGNK